MELEDIFLICTNAEFLFLLLFLLLLFCEVINSRHHSDGGGLDPSAEAGFRGRVGEIRQCRWLYTEMKRMREKYLSLRKDAERMGPYLVSDRL